MIKQIKGRFEDVSIRRADNGGYVFSVGCRIFICPNEMHKIKAMCLELGEYLQDPDHYIDDYFEVEGTPNPGTDNPGTTGPSTRIPS